MDRRFFLVGTSGIIASQILIGCNQKNESQFNVQVLKGSIPGYVVHQFSKTLESQVNLKFVPVDQIYDLFKQLQTWQQPEVDKQKGLCRWIPCHWIPFVQNPKLTKYDLVTLGDYWLEAAIKEKLIQPLETAQIKQWSALNKKWQQLVKRDNQGNIDPQGQVWAAPYRWGNTVIIYNREKLQKFDWQPKDWSDLWRSELRSRISLLNNSREVIGLVLKKLGKSYNTQNLAEIPSLKTELQALNQQVKFYDSTTYLEPLIMGDTWLAVGWSNDVIPILSRYPKLNAIIPQSGTAIWTDLWVRPAGTSASLSTGVGKNNVVSEWIDFCWQPNIAKEITILTKTNTPIPTNISEYNFPEPVQNLLLTNQELLDKSEFLLPLSSDAKKQYDLLFSKMKKPV